MSLFVSTLSLILNTLTLIVFVDVLLSWFLPPYHPLRESLDRIVEPMLQPIRNLLPRTGMIDLSPMILLILLQMIQRLLVQSFL